MNIVKDLKDQILSYYDNVIALIPKIAVAVVVVTVFFITISLIKRYFIRYFRSKSDDTLIVDFINNISNITNYVLSFLLFFYIIGYTGIAGTIVGTAGVSAIVFGFAFRDLGENFISGVLMAFDRPFRIGDTIFTNDVEGVIKGMTLRQTHLKTFDGKDVFVPNGQILKKPLFNYTLDEHLRYEFTVGVDYNTNLSKAVSTILDTIGNIEGVLNDKKPLAIINNLNTNTIDINVKYWANPLDDKHSTLLVKSEVLKACVDALGKSNISIPTTIIELKNYENKEIKTALLDESK